jgi:dephospho-CoA kinase
MGRLMRVGLTGGIATGKSYVRSRFEALGVPTIDADTLAREAVAPGSEGLAQVVRRFGPGVLLADGTLDRRALGGIVFSDPAARRDLEQIIHPLVRARTEAWFQSLDPGVHRFAVADIPLLFESGHASAYDATVVTACDGAEQIRRVVARDHLSAEEARRRIAAQMPTDEKVRQATFVIRTDGTHDDTDRQVRAVVEALSARASTWAV